jgi:hypothetical protein
MSFTAFRSLSTEQQQTATSAWSGMRALMLAVLEDGINNLLSPDRRLRAEAECWLKSQESRYVFSFVVICETLDFDTVAVRRSVIRTQGTRQTPGRFLSRSRPNVRRRGRIGPMQIGAHRPKVSRHPPLLGVA